MHTIGELFNCIIENISDGTLTMDDEVAIGVDECDIESINSIVVNGHTLIISHAVK